MEKLIHWFKQHAVLSIVAFFVAFIPLYPKLPLFDIVQTWVYIRLEDVLIALAASYYSIVHIRKKIWSQSPLTTPILAYWVVGAFVTVFSVIFIGPRIADYAWHLTALHYLRRIEYMLLFFIAYDAVKSNPKKALSIIISVLCVTIGAIVLYGMGQKFFGWPAFLTMNEEFAKGIPLRLPITGRIPSTFAGHYDLAAYLVLTIPILVSLIISARSLWKRIALGILFFGSYVLLLYTASRVSFGVYLITISLVFAWYRKYWLIVPAVIASILMMQLVSGASDRFVKTIRYEDVIIDLSTGRPIGTLKASQQDGSDELVVEKQESPALEDLPKGTAYIGVPSDQTKAPDKTYKTIIYYRGEDLATGSGEIATVSGSYYIQKALVYDISLTTRFQGQWPNALAAFWRNPILGSGFATLSTAVDGDYLRMLGETGIIGAVAFLGIFLMAFVVFHAVRNKLTGQEKAFVIGVFAGLSGLLWNAVLIDVFEASKVAYSLWIFLGISMAILVPYMKNFLSYRKVLVRVMTSNTALICWLLVIVFAVWGRVTSLYFTGDDFTWLRWASVGTFSDIGSYFTNSAGFFYRPIPKVWYFFLYLFFWLRPNIYHFASLILYAGTVLSLFSVLRIIHVPKPTAWIAAAFYSILSIHHENVFWISGQSSLMAALFFFLSLSLYIRYLLCNRYKVFYLLASIIFVLLAQGSYDGMIIAPLVIVLIGIAYRKHITPAQFILLFTIPFMWWARTNAGALGPWGDYGYRPDTFFINAAGNGIGYIVASFTGPRTIELMSQLRDVLRSYQWMKWAAGVAVLACAFVCWKGRYILRTYMRGIVWFVSAILMLTAYLGLGGMAERYGLVASGLCVIGCVELGRSFRISRWWKAAAVGIFLCLCIWNLFEVGKLHKEWQKASDVVRESVLAIKNAHFPMIHPKTFIFVNMPIKYGRAWIFNVGLHDALWHMFKFSPYWFETISVTDPAQAFEIESPDGGTYRFIFEDYKLKKLYREKEVIELPAEGM